MDSKVLLKTLTGFGPQKEWNEASTSEEYPRYGSPKEPEVITYNNIPMSKDSNLDYEELEPKFLEYVKTSKFIDVVEKFIVKRKSWGKLISLIKLLTYHKGSAPKPLQELSKRNQEKTQLIWKYITQYSGDRKMKFSPLVQVQKLLTVLSNSDVELIDEAYLLLIKQMTGCPKDETMMKLLRLCGIISSTVAPSPRIFFGVLNFLYNISNMNATIEQSYSAEVVGMAKYCFLRITKTFEGKPRRTIPLENEILFIEARRQLMIPVYFFTSNHIYIAVESYSTVKEAKEFALKKLDMHYRMPYMALYEVEKRDDVISER